ncbi:MAG: hypothetical protein IKU01_10920 [Bacteroidales bacterium]|nr:hypothetical protein [Bacteroidales bacterium]
MGYRRTGSNIFKTRSNKKMTSLVSKTMAYGLLAPFAALDSMSSSGHSTYIPGDPKHYSSKKHKIGIIIGGILDLLCPIGGFVTFYFFDWFMFFSVLVFGIIEIIISVIIIGLKDNKYIYQDETDIVSNEYNKNENIIITLLIGMIILNWSYPLILFFTWEWDPEFGGGIVLGMIGFKTLLIGAGGIPQLFQNKKDVKKDIRSIFYVRNRPKTDFESKSKSSLTKFSNDKKHKHNDLNNNQQFDNTHNLTIPKINGEYTEEFMDNYGTLRIGSTHAFIEFYFPGPDARYKGTFISIQENEIDKYINAYKNNWKTAEELRKKVLGTNTEFKCGEMDMNIIVSQNSIELCLSHYKLPIYSKEECDDIINHLNIAKHRIKEIRQRLFDK